MKKQTQCTLAPPRVSIHLLPSKMGHGCMSSTLAKQKQTKDHSPSMMLSEFPKQNDQVPQENCQKILDTIAIMVYTMTRAYPVNILTQGCPPNTMVKQHC